MPYSKFSHLTGIGQSIWYDNLARRLLVSGELEKMIQDGEIQGVTSNPSIFNQAIAKSQDYDAAIQTMSLGGMSSQEIYQRLTVDDIQTACDCFQKIYESTHAKDGYVSLEVSPDLAQDTDGTIAEAQRLWQAVNRPNLMIKVPATLPGLPAVRKLIAAGINVNVTLIFSLSRYQQVMEAYLLGLEDRRKAGKSLDRVASVASFFVSRMDTKVDLMLETLAHVNTSAAKEILSWQGKVAVANAKLAYREFESFFTTQRFLELKKFGAEIQRPLWASTGTKNPAYPDTLYVDELVGPSTVNTLPPLTLEAFRDHGQVRLALRDGLDRADQTFAALTNLGISLDEVTRQLETEGVKAFKDAYTSLLHTIDQRRLESLEKIGDLATPIVNRINRMRTESTVKRIFEHDAGLWTSDPAGQAEIRRRMSWLSLPETSQSLIPEIKAFVHEIQKTEITQLLLLGMGGSSLAPEVMQLVFTHYGETPGLHLTVLDSTDPAQVLAAARRTPARKTLVITASKSGTTTEVQALLDFFWARAKRSLGSQTPQHFIAITDPGTPLQALANERGFRKVFLADPQVGGRFSALSVFGLVPAALLGVDIEALLNRAQLMMQQCMRQEPAQSNPGLVLGVLLGEATLAGRDKLTLIADKAWLPLGPWLEQLVAESSGKEGLGILPVDGEPAAPPQLYHPDRLFVYMRTTGEHDRFTAQLVKNEHPVIILPVSSVYDLGAEFYRWEFATAVACAVLKVNPFDQPDVQDSKNRTKAKIAEFRNSGQLVEPLPKWKQDGIGLYGMLPDALLDSHPGLSEIWDTFFKQVKSADYVALNVYLPRNKKNERILARLRSKIQFRTGAATTLGFGPRFLHSTGQLHKGGTDQGVFLLITADTPLDFPIPGEGLTFGQLERAQALGDYEALLARGRRVMRVNLEHPRHLQALIDAFE